MDLDLYFISKPHIHDHGFQNTVGSSSIWQCFFFCCLFVCFLALPANIGFILPERFLGIRACSLAQSCLTLCDPMDHSPLGSSVHGIFSGKNTGVGCHFLLQGSFKSESVVSPDLANGFFTTVLPGEPSWGCKCTCDWFTLLYSRN